MSRQPSVAPTGDVELPITPMLDMTFQLLVFFIITYHPSALEGKMDFSLPAATRGDVVTSQSPHDEPGELEPTVALTVVAHAAQGSGKGSLSAVVVQTPGGETLLNSPEDLRSHLEQLRKGDNRLDEVRLQADTGLKYAVIVRLMDACRQSGFSRMSFVSPETASAE